MSTTDNSTEATNRNHTTPDTSRTDSSHFCIHYQQGGRKFLIDPNGDRVNLARLTAYAEHGEDVYGAVVHHQLPLFKIDVPEFLQPLSEEEHAQFHGGDPEPVYVDGIPLLRSDEEGEEVES